MTNQELFEEIKENRREIKKIHEDFYVFKGKAFGFLSVMSIVVNLAFSYLFKK